MLGGDGAQDLVGIGQFHIGIDMPPEAILVA